MFGNTKRLCALMLLALSALIGCGSSPERTDANAHVGVLSSALVATAQDGASYRFPAGALLLVYSETCNAALDLGTGEDQASVRLPVGAFVAVPVSTTQLERTSNGTTTLVDATLLNASPIRFDIAENQLTSLELRFQVTDLTAVTFSVGTLQVSLGVEIQQRQLLEDATVTVQKVTFGASATSEARDLLAVDVDAVLPYHLEFEPTGGWSMELVNTACIRGRLTSARSSPESLLAARFAEVIGSGATYCISDTGSRDLAFLQVFGATTPVDQSTALPGNNNLFYLLIDGTIDDVFDGVTLRQQELAKPHTFSEGHFTHRIVDGNANEIIADVFGSLDGDFQLKP